MSRYELLKRYCRAVKVFDEFVMYNNGGQIEIWLDFKNIGVVVEKDGKLVVETKSGKINNRTIERKLNEIVIEIMSSV